MERKCYLCGTEITGCFGYVVARDFINYMEKRTDRVRELCGKDVLRLELISEREGISISDLINDVL